MPEKKEGERGQEIHIDLGFGKVFKGLGDFIDLLGEIVETGEQFERSGEFRVKGLGDQARGVYGVSVRTSVGGIPQVERFGNIRSTEEGPTVDEVREPLVDVFDEAAEILIVVELPGVDEDEIHVEVRDDILSLETTGERRYGKEILLSQVVDPASLQKAYKNGILELRLKKA
jgi:HSP20 family protein